MAAPDDLSGYTGERPNRLELVHDRHSLPVDVAEDLGWLLRTLGGTGPRRRPYLVLHGHGALRLLVPAEPATIAAAFHRISDGQAGVHRAASAAIRALGRTGSSRLLPGARALLPALTVVDQLARQLDEPGLTASVLLGPRRPTRKPVLQLVRPDGSLVGYAKVGWSPATTALVDNEALALTLAGGPLGPRVMAPELVWAGRWRDRAVTVAGPLTVPGHGLALPRPRRRPGRPAGPLGPVGPDARGALADRLLAFRRSSAQATGSVPLDLALLDALAAAARASEAAHRNGPTGPCWTSPADAELVLSIAARVPGPPRPVADLLLWPQWEEAGLDRHIDLAELRRRHGDRILPLGLWHGDLGPWNVRTTRHHTMVWDWEHAGTDRPIGFDALHLGLERLRLDPWLPHRTALTAVVVSAADLLDPLGLDLAPADRQALVDLYLCELAARSLRSPGASWLSPLDGPGAAALDLLAHRLH